MPLLSLDPIAILTALGYVGLFCIVTAETGLFFGFFFPGDSLLFTAGLLAATGELNILGLLVLVPVAAIVGSTLGYWFGVVIGPLLFNKEDSFFFNKKHIERSNRFYAKHGPRALLLARFIPVVRTFVPILAGVAMMRSSTFYYYTILGAIVWGAGLTLIGFFLGHAIPNVERYITPVALLIIVISFLPIVWEWHKEKKKKKS